MTDLKRTEEAKELACIPEGCSSGELLRAAGLGHDLDDHGPEEFTLRREHLLNPSSLTFLSLLGGRGQGKQLNLHGLLPRRLTCMDSVEHLFPFLYNTTT